MARTSPFADTHPPHPNRRVLSVLVASQLFGDRDILNKIAPVQGAGVVILDKVELAHFAWKEV